MGDEEIEEALKKATPIKPNNGLPEAPASATIRFWIDGYGVMLTMRDEEVLEVVNKLQQVIKVAKKQNWKPTWKKEEEQDEQKEQKEVFKCHICGAEAEHRSGISKKGKKYAGIFCSANDEHIKWLTVK